jgi:hypothetical protein
MAKPALVAASPLTTPNFTEFAYDSIEEAFPTVDPGVQPFGFMGVFQIRQSKRVTRGGVILPNEVEKDQHYNTQIARVTLLGPLCFKSVKEIGGRDTLVDWPEGAWFRIGDFVRVPKYGGDRFTATYKRETTENGEKLTVKDQVVFAFFKTSNILGLVPNPLVGMAFLD